MTLTAITEQELLEQCRKGNQHAQMQVYDMYFKAMYNTSFRIVKDSAEAEDIMQEAFLRAFSKLHTFKGESTFGAWLKRIVANLSIAAYNKQKKYQEVSYEDEFAQTPSEPGGYLENEESYNTQVRLLLLSLEQLSENYRLILNLHLIEGFDHEEICEIMKITPVNCRTTLSRARESLRKKMMSYEK